jgi:hypothetical protein
VTIRHRIKAPQAQAARQRTAGQRVFIIHPRGPGQGVQAHDQDVPPFFVAHGVAVADVDDVVLTLTNDNDPTSTPVDPFFQDMYPLPDDDRGRNYWYAWYEIADEGHYSLTAADADTPDQVEHSADHFHVGRGGFGPITVHYPTSGDTVCSNFTAYGSYDSVTCGTNMSGTIGASGDQSVTLSGNNWSMNFGGVTPTAAGQSDTLTVQTTVAGCSQQVGTVYVKGNGSCSM